MADPQLLAVGEDGPRGVEIGGEDAEVDVGEDRAEQDEAVALLDELGHLRPSHGPLVEADVERMHLADHALGEHRGRHRDARRLGERDHVGLQPEAVQLDAGDDDRAAGGSDPPGRLAHGLGEGVGIAPSRRMVVGADLVGHDRDDVARQLEVDRPLVPVGHVEQEVDVAEGRGGIDDLPARQADLVEDLELRPPLAHAVVEPGVVRPLGDARGAGDEDHGALLGRRAGDRVRERQAAHAVGDAHRAHAMHARVGVGGEPGAVLPRAVHEVERAVLEHRVEGEHVVAGQAEDVPDPVVGEPADEVLPDREPGDALGPLHGRPAVAGGDESVVEAGTEDDSHGHLLRMRRARTASMIPQNPRNPATHAATTSVRRTSWLSRHAPTASTPPHTATAAMIPAIHRLDPSESVMFQL